jgi:molecular chaperone DnaK
MAADNKSLGRFILEGIPPAPRAVPQIEVTFDIDANGILNVAAEDRATGREQSMEIIPSSGLSDQQIEQMVEEAGRYREEDRQRREQAEARNWADTTIYSAERLLREHGDVIPADGRDDVEAKIEAVKAVLEGDDVGAIRRRTEELSQSMERTGAGMYQDEAGPGTAPADQDTSGEASPQDGDEVIEGDFSAA